MDGFITFNPSTDIPSLEGKVILVTGGTAGLGAGCVEAFARQNPKHIYFTGRNANAAEHLITKIKGNHPTVALTFIELDLSSLQSVKQAIKEKFRHDRLDILMNNAGIIAKPPELSVDGYEIQFATNHLGHAMLTQQLLPQLLATAEEPGSDVRIINNTSVGYEFHRGIKGGISFTELDGGSRMRRTILGPWIRYGHSKLASILFASELARRFPVITSVSIHPGLVRTPMNTEMDIYNKTFVNVTSKMAGVKMLEPEKGILNQLWCAAGASKDQLRNGSFYLPVGVENGDKLTKEGRDVELAKRLWDWTEQVLSRF